MRFRRILALSPHTDDAELGCGGTIARLIEEGADPFVAVFSIAEASRPPGTPEDLLQHECLEALPILGVPHNQITIHRFPVRELQAHRQAILEELIRLRREVDPDLILLPAGVDLHQDHQTVYTEGMRAFKERSVWGYELPWNHLSFTATAFVTLERRHLERKQAALRCYRSQAQLGRPYFQPGFMEGLAWVRGAQVKAELAEAFEVRRLRY